MSSRTGARNTRGSSYRLDSRMFIRFFSFFLGKDGDTAIGPLLVPCTEQQQKKQGAAAQQQRQAIVFAGRLGQRLHHLSAYRLASFRRGAFGPPCGGWQRGRGPTGA